MNFEDEHYVRIYTRKTKTVKKWGWEGRVLFRELMTVVDKAGVLDDIEDPVEDVALMAELPEDLVEVGLPKLLDSGAVEIRGTYLVIPNYIPGQTANKSDKNRAKESRQRRAAAVRLEELRGPSEDVTNRDGGVTKRTGCDESEHSRSLPVDVTERDTGVTNRDGVATNRSKTFAERPAASPNADQRSTTHLDPKAADVDPKTTKQEPAEVQRRRPRNLNQALELDVKSRAAMVLQNTHDAEWLCPAAWPEVIEVIDAFAVARGTIRPKLGPYQRDKGLQAVVVMLATFEPEQVQEVIRRFPASRFIRDLSGLSSLSVEVIRRLLDGDKAQPKKQPRRGPGPVQPNHGNTSGDKFLKKLGVKQ